MSRRKEITEHPIRNGVLRFDLLSWKHFSKLISRNLLKFPGYVYRGHAEENWLLESSLDRHSKRLGTKTTQATRNEHLRQFKKHSRGRRGSNPKVIQSNNEWWALGQHYGLVTPLLDWTESPFVALYYAFRSLKSESKIRVVFAMHVGAVKEKSQELKKGNKSARTIDVFTPDTDENPRLVSQGGLFTRLPDGVDLESWVRKHFKGYKEAVLIKICIPDRNRVDCLAALNRMNICHATLFPDLYGSAIFCNEAYGNPIIGSVM